MKTLKETIKEIKEQNKQLKKLHLKEYHNIQNGRIIQANNKNDAMHQLNETNKRNIKRFNRVQYAKKLIKYFNN